MAFHAPNVFVAGSANGFIAYFNLDSHQLKAVLPTGTKSRVEKVFLVTREVPPVAHHLNSGAGLHMPGHGNVVEDSLIMISFQVDGQIQFWQPRLSELLFEIEVKLPRFDERIDSADVNEEHSILAFGSSYGNIRVWSYKPALPKRNARAALEISAFKGSDSAISYVQLILERMHLIAGLPDGTIVLFTLCGIKLGIFGQLQLFSAAITEAQASARSVEELIATAVAARAKAAQEASMFITELPSAPEPDKDKEGSAARRESVMVQEPSSVFLTDMDLRQDTPLHTDEIPMGSARPALNRGPASHPRSRSVMGSLYGGQPRGSMLLDDANNTQPPRPASLPNFGLSDVQLPLLVSTSSAAQARAGDRTLKMDVDRVLSMGPSIRERLHSGVDFSIAHRLPLKLPAIVRTPRALAAKAAIVRRKELWNKLKTALRNKCAKAQCLPLERVV
jgi:hypothetical protein